MRFYGLGCVVFVYAVITLLDNLQPALCSSDISLKIDEHQQLQQSLAASPTSASTSTSTPIQLTPSTLSPSPSPSPSQFSSAPSSLSSPSSAPSISSSPLPSQSQSQPQQTLKKTFTQSATSGITNSKRVTKSSTATVAAPSPTVSVIVPVKASSVTRGSTTKIRTTKRPRATYSNQKDANKVRGRMAARRELVNIQKATRRPSRVYPTRVPKRKGPKLTAKASVN